jgi:hypothetical protein
MQILGPEEYGIMYCSLYDGKGKDAGPDLRNTLFCLGYCVIGLLSWSAPRQASPCGDPAASTLGTLYETAF